MTSYTIGHFQEKQFMLLNILFSKVTKLQSVLRDMAQIQTVHKERKLKPVTPIQLL